MDQSHEAVDLRKISGGEMNHLRHRVGGGDPIRRRLALSLRPVHHQRLQQAGLGLEMKIYGLARPPRRFRDAFEAESGETMIDELREGCLQDPLSGLLLPT